MFILYIFNKFGFICTKTEAIFIARYIAVRKLSVSKPEKENKNVAKEPQEIGQYTFVDIFKKNRDVYR